MLADEPRQAIGLLEIRLGAAEGDNLAHRGKRNRERPPDLSVLAQQQQFHAYCFSTHWR